MSFQPSDYTMIINSDSRIEATIVSLNEKGLRLLLDGYVIYTEINL